MNIINHTNSLETNYPNANQTWAIINNELLSNWIGLLFDINWQLATLCTRKIIVWHEWWKFSVNKYIIYYLYL